MVPPEDSKAPLCAIESNPAASPLTIVRPASDNFFENSKVTLSPYGVGCLVPIIAIQSLFNKSMLPLQNKQIGGSGISNNSSGYFSEILVRQIILFLS